MKSNLNTELLEYLQQAGKEITKGYIEINIVSLVLYNFQTLQNQNLTENRI